MRSASASVPRDFSRAVFVRVLLAVATLAVTALSDTLAAALAASQNGSVTRSAHPVFRDVARSAGLDFVHTNGASDDKFFPEIMGSGGLLFDFDNDGWLDVFLVDGGSFADPRLARRARHRLYRNRGAGSFEDVTSASGIRHRDYGM